ALRGESYNNRKARVSASFCICAVRGCEAGGQVAMMQGDTETVLTGDERGAMRSYLQRAEVRLSTLHRIGVAFISGAGLLFLLPVFFKEDIVVLIELFLMHIPQFTVQQNGLSLAAAVVLYLCVLYPFLLSLAIPVYALYLMLK